MRFGYADVFHSVQPGTIGIVQLHPHAGTPLLHAISKWKRDRRFGKCPCKRPPDSITKFRTSYNSSRVKEMGYTLQE